jgi:outer membrane receptor protein involved in Fe transport
MNMSRLSRHSILIAIAVSVYGIAQQDAAAQALEEMIVTARKVEESLQDVPLSVTVMSGDKLTEAGITKIEELVLYVPNVTMSETGIGTNLYIRGIGSGINQGFEQSVGMYIDGVYHGRAQLMRAPFLDLAQAEVLRGPQVTLLGNNSIAGAMNLTTAKPSDEFEASVAGLYEPDHNEQELTGILSGPLFSNLAGRLAVRYRSMDGYLDNNILATDEPDREETSARFGRSKSSKTSRRPGQARAIPVSARIPAAMVPILTASAFGNPVRLTLSILSKISTPIR